ncbi:hypothetical protein BGZ63DRAFT_435832, partial [Mariannaea sp. PMI_226]
LSVAARHLAVLEDYNPIAADERHQKCVQQLRQRLSCLAGGNGSLEDDILAATVVLRLDSEFEVLETGLENHCHLLGTQGLLHCYEKAATLSRFQKVVAWIGLRQDVIISFMEQRSVNFPLHHFSAEWDDFPNGEVDWPNLIVYHLADVLNHCCRAEAIRIEDYDRLKSRAELYCRRCRSISVLRVSWGRPGYSFGHSVLSSLANCSHTLPSLKVATWPWQSFFEYRAQCKWNFIPRQWRAPFTESGIQRMIETTMRDLCGVGQSHSSCACAIGLACMGITMCRDRFEDPDDQEVFSQIITFARHKHGWQVRIP